MRISIFLVPLVLFCACSATATTYDDCISEGGRVLKTSPPRCISKQGEILIKNLDVVPKKKKICEDLCGNNTCEEIVCLAEGCPCAETAESCPSDCKEQ